MSKTYTPEEVAKAVLKKCQELNEEHKLKKAEEIDKCGDMSKEKSPMEKSSHLKNFMEKKKKKKDLKKIGGGTQTTGAGGAPLPGSVATTGGPSIASQIGFGKGDMKKAKVDAGSSIPEKQAQRSLRNEVEFESKDGKWERKGTPKGQKGVHQPTELISNTPKEKRKGVFRQSKMMPKPNLPKSEDGLATANKAVGLKPITSDKIKAPPADQMPEKPKAATTLKSYMAKRKK